ncbi:MAG: twin-arginine translocation signal domain-containing protein [Planctomycetaceae bacterium]
MSTSQPSLPRRDFLKQAGIATFSAAALSSFALPASRLAGAETAAHGIKKAVKIGMVGEGATLLDKFKLVKSSRMESN